MDNPCEDCSYSCYECYCSTCNELCCQCTCENDIHEEASLEEEQQDEVLIALQILKDYCENAKCNDCRIKEVIDCEWEVAVPTNWEPEKIKNIH